MAKNVGPGAAAAPDDKAGNLTKQIPVCIGARLMLTSNLWQPVGLCNGARGTVYDIAWAPGADPMQDPPCVIMMEFDKYTGPVFLATADGRKIVPILPVDRDFLVGATLCSRTQFPLITGLSYVAVSRVKTLQGLILDAPFDRNHLTYASPPEGIKMKMRDQQLRKRQTGPVFLTTADGRKIVPILPVDRDFLVGATLCTRMQFPLIVCYAGDCLTGSQTRSLRLIVRLAPQP
ncbi:hypothetical protein HIM_10559 [Hirsutella minnesotensis 3608]|uniref:DNA helicase Pif1-like 2B domain-containing protein n=1 Tax=Hirsutella minnesotensis 3608 TaxID=1043627 RepID=A0A0F7ZJY1_9HYPO|nr:hypothetical protein HIM_10559 [Hirsutella minnesotensis 3608]